MRGLKAEICCLKTEEALYRRKKGECVGQEDILRARKRSSERMATALTSRIATFDKWSAGGSKARD